MCVYMCMHFSILAGEPVFVAAPNAQSEDDGVVMTLVLGREGQWYHWYIHAKQDAAIFWCMYKATACILLCVKWKCRSDN